MFPSESSSSVLKGDGHDEAVRGVLRDGWLKRSGEVLFFFPLSSCAEDTRVEGAAVHVSPQLLGEEPGGGSFSEESPSNISEVASVSEDDDVDLAVEHGRDGEGLSLTGLQEHTAGVTIALNGEGKERKRVLWLLLLRLVFLPSL